MNKLIHFAAASFVCFFSSGAGIAASDLKSLRHAADVPASLVKVPGQAVNFVNAALPMVYPADEAGAGGIERASSASAIGLPTQQQPGDSPWTLFAGIGLIGVIVVRRLVS